MHLTWRMAIAVGIALSGACHRDVPSDQTLTLATTTSTRDSGLLAALIPRFERATGIKVHVVAVGTGQALAMGRRGDADVLLTHAPDAEKSFVAEGHARQRVPIMFNDFILVGPADDPAEIRSSSDIVAALGAIAERQARFVSRGDQSGTHSKEQALWRAAGIEPHGKWYLQAGQGMAGTLRVASEKQAYTLSDRSTFLAHRRLLELDIVCEGDERLRNEYAVLVVSPKRHPHVHFEAARQFAQFLRSPEARQVIKEFGKDRYGQALFSLIDP